MKVSEFLNKYVSTVVFGAGDRFKTIWRGQLPVKYVVDSDPNKWNTRVAGLEIFSPSKLCDEDKTTAILICSSQYKEILKKLEDMKVKCDYFVSMPNMLMPVDVVDFDHSNLWYGCFAEDAMLMGVVNRYGIKIKHYIDLGANHPLGGNVTYLFYQQGADGILIEPNPDWGNPLKSIRPRDLVMIAGVGGSASEGNTLKYYSVVGWDTRNTFSSVLAEKYREEGFEVIEKDIPMRSLNSIFEEYGKHVDYMSIDAEGFENEILKDFDFDKYRVGFLNVEGACGDHNKDDSLRKLIERNGYRMIGQTLSNYLFAHKSIELSE